MLTYEDGHIQRKTEFSYTINNGNVIVSIVSPRACYKYHQLATVSAPYAVDEYVDVTINGTKVNGTKKGTQVGPDMNNGYAGTLVGTLDKNLITAVFSYTVDGSQGKEKELYKVVSAGLQKMRYPLIMKAGVLVPDLAKKYTHLEYVKVDCL